MTSPEHFMAVSRDLSSFLKENLDKVTEPSSYASLRKKLMESRPTHAGPVIQQSPENSLKIDSVKIDTLEAE
jgi:hypothetical protein